MILGFIGGLLVTVALVPQLIRTFQTKNADGISLLFTILLWAGMWLWIMYGISLGLIQVIIWNAIGMTLVSVLIVMKIRYGRRRGKL